MLRSLRYAVTAAIVLGAPLQSAFAQTEFPNRPVKIVVPSAPGGSSDIVARILAQGMSEDLGQQVLIDNRGGAGGRIASDLVGGSAPDGYTVAFFTVSAAILNDALQKAPPVTVRKALAPVSLIGVLPQLIVINPKVPAKDLQEFVKLMRDKPGQVTYGSSGPGTILHLSGHLIASRAGATAQHVPYKGAGLALRDVVAGNVDMMVEGFPSLLPFVKSGQLRALALAAPERSANLPDLPTTTEAGLPNLHILNWMAVLAPAATPAPVMKRLETSIRTAMKAPATRTRLTETGLDLVGSTAEEARVFWDKEIELWQGIVRDSGAKIE